MRGVCVLVAFVAVVIGSPVSRADSGAERVAYRLLAVEGINMKWGHASLGSPAVIRYAFVTAPVTRTEATNCERMVPFPDRMRSGGVAFDKLADEFHAAFETWEKVANITFVYVTDQAEADVLIGAQRSPRGIAFADVNFRTPRASGLASISTGAICLNPEALWKTEFDQRELSYDIRYVALHEIGHVLGLNHTWGRTPSVMNFRYQETVRKLQPADVAGARLLYGPRPTRAASNSAVPAPTRF